METRFLIYVSGQIQAGFTGTLAAAVDFASAQWPDEWIWLERP